MPPRPATISIRCPAKMVPGSSSPTGERYIDHGSWRAIHPVVTDGVRRGDGSARQKAGDRGIEPRARVLETPMLPLHQSPSGGHCRRHRQARGRRTFIGRLRATIRHMLRSALIAVVLVALSAGEAHAAVLPFGPDLAPLAANADPRASCASGTPTPIPMGVGGSCMWSFMG